VLLQLLASQQWQWQSQQTVLGALLQLPMKLQLPLELQPHHLPQAQLWMRAKLAAAVLPLLLPHPNLREFIKEQFYSMINTFNTLAG
jgi:hypothetical protein